MVAGIRAALAVGACTAAVVALEARRAAEAEGRSPTVTATTVLPEPVASPDLRLTSLTERRATGLAADQPAAPAHPRMLGPARAPSWKGIPMTGPYDTLTGPALTPPAWSCDCRRRGPSSPTPSPAPRSKWLSDFDYTANRNIIPALISNLATCEWVKQGEPLCLIGDSGTGKSHLLIGTGKSHLLIGLGSAAAMAGFRVRYTLVAKLVNELVEAADEKQLTKTIARYGRVDLLCIDEQGYLELDRRGAEMLFQVLSEREGRTAWPSPPTHPSGAGRRRSPTPGSARPSSTDSPSTAPSSRPVPSPTASPRPKPSSSTRRGSTST